MPRVTRNSAARLANANNNGSTTATTTELTAPSSVRTTRSQTTANNDNEEEEDAAPIVIRRSTRRAAIDAKARIAEETKARIERKRRSRRNVDNMEDGVAQQQHSPLANSLDLKPAALSSGAKKLAAQSFKSEENADDDLSQLEEFTCAICLDKPDTLVDLATISGCTHKFCFDCIDKWAETENKCPCCKQRFNRIDRVKKLPPATPPTTSRRGKRKRSDNTNNSGSNTRRRTGEATGGAASAASAAAAASAPRVNSRTVEDRNQQHMPAGLSFALLESIFNSAFMGPGGLGSMQAGGERGRTTFRFPVPPSMAGDGDLDDMAGMLRMILQDATIGGPSARFTVQVRRTTGPANAGGGGAGAAASAAAPPAAARASGGAASRASSSPRSSRGSSRASSNGESRASRQQRSTLFSYFGNSPSSRRSRSSASGAARSSSAARPASRRDSGVIDLAGSDSE
ncbi:hypothetical protein QTG54_002409 [Skeletonema marinoi]|uniref:RING-type domain-containing protein n=1 Tax=Skeletonema marinoi TaxID=267567 RepID=A0AAD8YL11_9STRA|nr:hypothetical protein QTG54_002409 [Skeletonema marinoi]